MFKVGDEVQVVSRKGYLTDENLEDINKDVGSMGVITTVDHSDSVIVYFGEEDAWLNTEDLALAGQATKDTNPKDAVGTKKPPASTVSALVVQEVGVAMLEGARKYGRHNYRVAGVRTSVYYDAAMRHLQAFWEGQDEDPDSGLSHITKAIASLVVLRDAQINDKVTDDRPPVNLPYEEFLKTLQDKVDEVFEKYPDAKEAYTNE